MKKYLYLIVSGAIFSLFILFTVLVKTVDVTYIYSNTYLGFTKANMDFGNWVMSLQKYDSMKKISDIFFYISFGYVAILAGIGLYQLIKNKSLKAVDKRLWLLLAGYVVVVIFYFIFELVKVNYSPDVSEGIKASYPSSHVFIGCSFYLLNTYVCLKLLNSEKKWINYLAFGATLVICVLLTFSRALSAKHWLTDIIASVLLVISIYFAFVHFYHYFFSKESETKTEE